MLQEYEERNRNNERNDANQMHSPRIRHRDESSPSSRPDYDNDDSSGNLVHFRPSQDIQSSLLQAAANANNNLHRQPQLNLFEGSNQRGATSTNNNNFGRMQAQYRGVRDILEEDQAQGLLHA